MQMLQDGVKKIQESEEYRRYLKIMSSFPEYSSRNILLIFQQCPQATFVAGYQTWKNRFHRQVRRGEKAIRIFAPHICSNAECDEEQTERRIGFHTISVFDVSQTEGEPLPSFMKIHSLEGEVEMYDELFEAICESGTFEVVFDELEEDQSGCCRYWDGVIRLKKGMSQLQTIKTLIHETAHSILHNPYSHAESEFAGYVLENANAREMEAESVAFVVCSHFGLNCSEYSFSYVACWKQNEQFFEQSLRRIQKTADDLILSISEKLFPEEPEDCCRISALSSSASLVPPAGRKSVRRRDFRDQKQEMFGA